MSARAPRLIALVAGGLAGAVAAFPALGQDAPPEQRRTESVTVTARKQAESLQTVPVTVTAVGGADLDRFQYDKIEDVVTRIPTLNVQIGGSGSGAQLSLRGVGSSNISAAFDSAVALDFDGVQVSTMRILQSGFMDVQQIEVLKGPQSLYFGKSASGGVLSIKSKNPTPDWEYGGKVAYEIEERGYTLEAYTSGPITDTLGIRLAARFNDIEKLLYNTAPVADPKRGEQNINARATFQLDPSDNFSANLKLNYVRHENDGGIFFAVNDCGANGRPDEIYLLSGGFVVPPGYGCDSSGKTYFLPDIAPPLAIQSPAEAPEPGSNNGVPYGVATTLFAILKMDWEISDSLTLTSVTGYVDQSAQDQDEYSYGGLLNGVSFGVGTGLTDHQLEQFSQELRLASDFNGPFNFMLGAFYETRHSEFNTGQQAVNISLVGRDPVTGNTFDWYKRHITNGDAFSVFGSASFDITDRLELSGGLRWTKEKKTNNILVPYVHTFLSSGPAFIDSGFDSGPIRFKDDNFSPEVTLSYQATDDINFYGSFKTGFKSGGIDNSALPSSNLLGFASDDPAVREATANALIYRSETAKGGEIGMKSQWADQTVTLNLAGYYYVFDDLQVQNFDAVAIQFATSNAGEVTTKGLDLDLAWVTPVDGLRLFGALAYTDAKYTDFFDSNPNNDPAIDDDLNGRSVARAPKWAGNIGADLRIPVGNAWELGITGNIQFSGKYFTNEDSFDDIVQSSYVTFDLAVSIGDPDGTWQLAVIGTNLTDELYVQTSGGRPFLAPPGNVRGLPAGDDQILNYNRGRQLAIEASFKF
ncbi:TonB-dependent receptor [Iodidimonas sp. SYSU 1G8]|uniref:TonB-dependent receptor n=1 Tax=Iodidimonas sp. SYSU 1G8 TaxID=3133967 RepID=UPI0031FF2780